MASRTGWSNGFRASRHGTAALEFALVGPVLLLLVFMIIENGLMLFAQAVLDNATRAASRQIMINAVTTSANFRTAVCSNMSTFLDCTALQFYVTSSSSAFPSALAPSSTGTFSSSTFSTGNPGDFVLVEVAYDRSFITPWIIQVGGGGWVLLSTQAFQNEPSVS